MTTTEEMTTAAIIEENFELNFLSISAPVQRNKIHPGEWQRVVEKLKPSLDKIPEEDESKQPQPGC